MLTVYCTGTIFLLWLNNIVQRLHIEFVITENKTRNKSIFSSNFMTLQNCKVVNLVMTE